MIVTTSCGEINIVGDDSVESLIECIIEDGKTVSSVVDENGVEYEIRVIVKLVEK
jgi:hypothetical protein